MKKMTGFREIYESAPELEREIFSIWCRMNPGAAFGAGLNEYAGRLFIREKAVVEGLRREIDGLLGRAKTELQIAFLNNLRTTLEFEEPETVVDEFIWGIYAHLVKEGAVKEHMSALLQGVERGLRLGMETMKSRDWPVEIRVMTSNELQGLSGILSVVKNEAPEFADRIEEINGIIEEYHETFASGMREEGNFDAVFPVLEERGGDIGRKALYPTILKNIYGYHESPDEIEKQGLYYLEMELPYLKNIVNGLASDYGVEAELSAVAKAVTGRSNIEKSKIVDFVNQLRERTLPVVNAHLVEVNPDYDTRVTETPSYLVNFLPTAAMNPFNDFTEKPFNIFFVTTDERRSPPAGAADLFQVLVHEEYGHCVNFSNTSKGYGVRTSLLSRIPSTFSLPVSEGISFNREHEALTMLKDIAAKERPEPAEAELLEYISERGDIEQFIREVEFIVMKWRIIRFLRAIGDVRINMHKQSVAEFVEWASEKTGLSRNLIFDQIFIFQTNPGYAPCYFIAGEALRGLQRRAVEAGKDIREFNTLASALGFPPRFIYERQLEEFIHG